MIAIQWREKLIAAALHFAVTSILAVLAALLIFLIWFPNPFDQMVGGGKLFGLVIGCDLVLGPLISLVIFNSKKTYRELIFDYLLIGGLQLGALIYGVSVVSGSRPAFIVFVKDRLEVVTAMELDNNDLVEAEIFNELPWFGPKLAATSSPDSPAERSQVLFSALAGKDIQLMPKYYRAYDSQLAAIKDRASPIAQLIERKPQSKGDVLEAINALSADESSLRWLPVKHRFGFWTAIIDYETGRPLTYLPIDPY